MALMNLKNHGITEERIILLNNFLESNGYKTTDYTVQTHAAPNSQFHGVAEQDYFCIEIFA
jgi:hypothetical protein